MKHAPKYHMFYFSQSQVYPSYKLKDSPSVLEFVISAPTADAQELT